MTSIFEFQQHCVAYLTELRTQLQNPHATSELSLRAALDNLLQNAKGLSKRDVVFTGEGKMLAQGRPDFIVSTGGVPIGYIEAEKIDSDLDRLSGHAKEQNERFIANLDHFLLTNHLDFHLYQGGKMVAASTLPAPPDTGKIVVPEAKAEKLFALLEQLIHAAPPPIGSPRDLAFHLSRRARQMRAAVLETLQDPDAEIQNDYRAFKEVLLPNLEEASFADMYAQTIAYGLFAARCNYQPQGKEKFKRHMAGACLAGNPFLKKLFTRFAGELDASLAWIADDMAALLADAPIGDIQQYFFKRTGNADPMIDFYEPFLRAYNAKLKDLRGVYYTPQPVVQYIVKSLHHLLKTHWDKPHGLADESTLILDPATGTGSFLFGVIDQIHDEVKKQKGSAAWAGYVEKHLLNRVFGFELMMAPYSIAHLKLGLQLDGKSAPVAEGERFGIYLTNTLDDAMKKGDTLFAQFVSDEANAAVKIKNEEPILVVLGNPPYKGVSANPSRKSEEEIKRLRAARKSGSKLPQVRGAVARMERNLEELTYIGRLIEKYKSISGKRIEETNLQWLQNDYVKFIAYAQERINKTGEGVLGYITSHSYLDNPTFSGMRWHLMQTFTDIYILDLHGNSDKKEKAPDGSADQNVFEITQGTAILLCVKQKDKTGSSRVHHAELWGKRSEKYSYLLDNSVDTTIWQELRPTAPRHYFIPQDTDLLPEYSRGWEVTDIFPVNQTGLIAGRDSLSIAFDENELWRKVNDFSSLPVEVAREKYKLRKDARDWGVERAQQDIKKQGLSKSNIKKVLYRPFDVRSIYYTQKSRGFLRWPYEKFMGHLIHGQNLALVTSRMTKGESFAHIQVSSHMVEVICMSPNTSNNGFVFPLYLYPDQNSLNFDDKRRPNLSAEFLKALAEKLGLPTEGEYSLPQGISPEGIFHYAYAIFHAPAYRARYAAFLKTDFPRLPLTSDLQLFRDLAKLGEQLVALHLLNTQEAQVLHEPRHLFEGEGDNTVEKVEYFEIAHRVKINTTQGFENVPREVWEFRVGGYQVADKWLKDRKGRVLSYDDISHYARVLIALAETARLMQEIDARIGEWPLQ